MSDKQSNLTPAEFLSELRAEKPSGDHLAGTEVASVDELGLDFSDLNERAEEIESELNNSQDVLGDSESSEVDEIEDHASVETIRLMFRKPILREVKMMRNS